MDNEKNLNSYWVKSLFSTHSSHLVQQIATEVLDLVVRNNEWTPNLARINRNSVEHEPIGHKAQRELLLTIFLQFMSAIDCSLMIIDHHFRMDLFRSHCPSYRIKSNFWTSVCQIKKNMNSQLWDEVVFNVGCANLIEHDQLMILFIKIPNVVKEVQFQYLYL